MALRFGLFTGIYGQDKNNKNKRDIIQQLRVLKVNDAAINQILAAIEKMPGSSHLLGALNFFTALTDQHSRCENYYVHSDYIAEYFCTLSNLGFFAVAFYYRDYATLFAATFSTLSHAIPLKRLNELDKIAAVTVFLKVMLQYELLTTYPKIITAGLATFSIGALDILVGRKHKDSLGPLFHSAWHLAAAFALYQFNQGKADVSTRQLKELSQAVIQNVVPVYLQRNYDIACKAITVFSGIAARMKKFF